METTLKTLEQRLLPKYKTLLKKETKRYPSLMRDVNAELNTKHYYTDLSLGACLHISGATGIKRITGIQNMFGKQVVLNQVFHKF